MAGTTSSSASNPVSTMKKRNSNDIGWQYAEIVDPKNLDKLKCLLCTKIVSGGINRMKQHIAQIKGNVEACGMCSKEDTEKCLKAIEEVRNKKKQKLIQEEEVRQEVVIEEDEMEGDEASQGSRRKRRMLGPMDRFASAIDPDSSLDGSNKMKQQNINDSLFKERTHKVHQYLARWVYEAGLPFHAIENDSFKRFVEAVGQFGPGYRPPTQYQLREPLLKEEVERTKGLLKKQEEEWANGGCSIMTDAWSDRKRRSIMNLCVNCAEGTTFLSSKEASDESHTGQFIFEYVDKCIEEIGPQKVVQVVTDNASNNMAAGDLLKLKRPTIFWTSCATHTVNLMLQGIGAQPKFKNVIDKAKSFTIYIYAHHKTLHLMRKYTKKRDIVRPGVTRFATAFLTLQSLMEKKHELRTMITSSEWSESKHAKSVKGKAATSIALSASYWNGVNLCLKVFSPLVKVLRLVDGDRKPSMGFVYGELQKAREEIKKTFKDKEAHYRPILDIVDGKARDRLDSPLHLTGYLLNPLYTYADPSIANDELVMDGFLTCVENFFPDDINIQDKVTNVELHKFLKKEGLFGKPLALRGCSQDTEDYNPVGWWNLYGNHTPKLQSMAKRILGLTTSSSGCERNWSTFEGIHTKKRNRLDATRLNNLVYVQFNAKIINKKKREREKNVDVLLANEATMAQGWIVDGGDDDNFSNVTSESVGDVSGVDSDLEPRRSSRIQEIRELEEDFESDAEEEENIDFEFDSDTEEVLEGYGEEELEEIR